MNEMVRKRCPLPPCRNIYEGGNADVDLAKHLVIDHHCTQAHAAKLMEVGRSTISQWVNGTRRISGTTSTPGRQSYTTPEIRKDFIQHLADKDVEGKALTMSEAVAWVSFSFLIFLRCVPLYSSSSNEAEHW